MYVRLAFAVAAHLEPEILLVDEVLAVGDAQFQKKCLGKMKDISKGGKTIIFVSHNMTALKSLCTKAILLDKGKIIMEGDTDTVVNQYLQQSTSSILEQVWDDIETAPGNDKVRIHKARLSIDSESEENIIRVDTPLKVEFQCWNLISGTQINYSMHVFNTENLLVFATVSNAIPCPKGIIRGICHIPANFLNDEAYSIMIMIVKDMSASIFTLKDILVFEVKDGKRESAWYGKWPGVVRPKLKWDMQLLTKGEE
jgi:lipopolysaccharide transport system ATP-binding protein